MSWKEAATYLLEGGILVYPTDTVWGVGCRADWPETVVKCLRLKGESRHMTCSVIVPQDRISQYVAVPQGLDLSPFFPGPYTLIFPLIDARLTPIAGPGPSLGCRVPALAVLNQMVQNVGVPILTTSVNDSGNPPAQTAAQARDWAQQKGIACVASEFSGSKASSVLRWHEGDWQVIRGCLPEKGQ
ncbi:MAG: Sua5/YciO/YrdC/YwlC family protein [Acidobacteria bacterium]|nr:Sua5/YciO/YrdC/YwlC family protein [Acidobacteriota bacterium]MCB9397429.1 Sua5/YciO/YrdC/YwlC family protein [Acidobacteriota bacterium]